MDPGRWDRSNPACTHTAKDMKKKQSAVHLKIVWTHTNPYLWSLTLPLLLWCLRYPLTNQIKLSSVQKILWIELSQEWLMCRVSIIGKTVCSWFLSACVWFQKNAHCVPPAVHWIYTLFWLTRFKTIQWTDGCSQSSSLLDTKWLSCWHNPWICLFSSNILSCLGLYIRYDSSIGGNLPAVCCAIGSHKWKRHCWDCKCNHAYQWTVLNGRYTGLHWEYPGGGTYSETTRKVKS